MSTDFGQNYSLGHINATVDTSIVTFSPSVDMFNISQNASSLLIPLNGSGYGQTKIHIAFSITGAVNIISGLLYLLLDIKKFEKVPPSTRASKRGTNEVLYNRACLTKCEKIMFTLVMGVVFFMFVSVECKNQSFLLPFVMLQLGWSKFDGTYLLSILWGFFTFGRALGLLFVARYLSPQRLVSVCLSIASTALVCLIIGGALKIDALMWAFVPFLGLGVSVVFPTYVVWIHENVVKVKGKVGGLTQFVGGVAFFVDPFLMGYLIENVTPMSLVYTGLGQALCSLGTFLLLAKWIDSKKQ